MIRRFILDEDGVLLVCSDGLSDQGFLEDNWQTFAPVIIQERLTPDVMLKALLDQAIEKNTHDNISVAIAFYGITPQHPVVINTGELMSSLEMDDLIFEPMLTPSQETTQAIASQDEEDDEDLDEMEEHEESQWSQTVLIALGLITLLIVTALVAFGLDRFVRRNQKPDTPTTPNVEQPANTN
jgi:protein phosphatase